MAKAVINLQKESGGIVKISPVDGTGVTEVTVPESGNLVSVGTAVTDNAIARYDGTTGKVQNSGVVIDDDNNVGIGTNAISAGGLTVKGNTLNYSQIHLASGTTAVSSRQAYFRSIDGGSVGTFDGKAFSGLQIGTLRPDGNANTSIAFYTALGATLTRQVLLDPSGNLLLTSGTGALGYGTGAGGIVTQLTSKSTAVTLNKPSGRITMNNAALAAGAVVNFQFNNSLMVSGDSLLFTFNPDVADVQINYSISSWSYNGYAGISIKNQATSTLSQPISFNFQLFKGAIA